MGNNPSDFKGSDELPVENVSWCADWSDPSYYASSPSADPPGAGFTSYRIVRGGS